MNDILNYNDFTKVELINKGWSGDKKYYVETEQGYKCLLRISDISEYDKKKTEFDCMKKMAKYGIKMSQPIDFGICNDGKSVYQLLSWCVGEEAKEALCNFSEKEQYAFGQKAAGILRMMEQIDRKPASTAWAEAYKQRVERYIKLYRDCGYTFEDDDVIIGYLQTHHDCIGERPTALMHEDFQTDNMVISSDGELYTIDFQMCGEVDPYCVMTGVGVSAEFSQAFAMGQMDGYFGGTVPNEFWDKYHYYMITEMLYAFTVGVHMDEEREGAIHMFDDEIEQIKSGNSCIPDWYRQYKGQL